MTGEFSVQYIIDHFKTVVEPAVLEFLASGKLDSVRHGYQAAIMLSHMAEYAFHAGLPTTTAKCSGEYYQELAATNEAHKLLADVCDASKHAILRPTIGKRSAKRNRAFLAANAVKSSPMLADSSRPVNSDIPINQDILMVTFDRGPERGTYRELDLAVLEVLTYWRKQLGLTP